MTPAEGQGRARWGRLQPKRVSSAQGTLQGAGRSAVSGPSSSRRKALCSCRRHHHMLTRNAGAVASTEQRSARTSHGSPQIWGLGVVVGVLLQVLLQRQQDAVLHTAAKHEKERKTERNRW